MQFQTLGVWLGFDFPLSLKREGIGRVFFYLIKNLLKNYPHNCELWCYDCNREEVIEMFSDLLNNREFTGRIKVITENNFAKSDVTRWSAFKKSFRFVLDILLYAKPVNWKQPYTTYSNIFSISLKKRKTQLNNVSDEVMHYALVSVDIVLSIVLLLTSFIVKVLRKTFLRNAALSNQNDDCLSILANQHSKADCFLIYIVTLENALSLKMPKLVFLPDLVTLEFYDYFIEQDPNARHWIEFGKRTADKFAEQNAYFCGISEYGIEYQLMKYIKPIKKGQATFVYLASMMPQDIARDIPKRDDLLNEFKITRKYIFYPTQIRVYKNIITLLKALKLLKSYGIDLQLVLTGQLHQDKNAYEYAKNNDLLKDIVLCGSLAEIDLFGLYSYAEMTVSPSLFEGGFPLQALESLSMNTPVILARIPVTIERLRFAGFDPEKSGLRLFEPDNENDLTENIMKVMNNRDKAVSEQQAVKNALLSYTWDHVSRRYHAIFSAMVNGEDIRISQ